MVMQRHKRTDLTISVLINQIWVKYSCLKTVCLCVCLSLSVVCLSACLSEHTLLLNILSCYKIISQAKWIAVPVQVLCVTSTNLYSYAFLYTNEKSFKITAHHPVRHLTRTYCHALVFTPDIKYDVTHTHHSAGNFYPAHIYFLINYSSWI